MLSTTKPILQPRVYSFFMVSPHSPFSQAFGNIQNIVSYSYPTTEAQNLRHIDSVCVPVCKFTDRVGSSFSSLGEVSSSLLFPCDTRVPVGFAMSDFYFI